MDKFKYHTVMVNGQPAAYWEKNHVKKECIVLLHGFPGSHIGLIDLAHGLPSHYRIIIPDFPACGKTPALPYLHSLENYAAWLHYFLEALDIRQPVVLGHSFGARVSLMFAATYPQRLKKLILITPVAKMDGILVRIASLKGTIAKMLPEYMRKKWLSNRLYQYAVQKVIFKSASQKRRQEISNLDVEESKHTDVRATIEIFDEFYEHDLTELGSRVAVHSLVVASDKDEVATPSSVQKLVDVIPAVKLEVMKNSGHLVPLERPKATAKIVTAWLEHVNG